MADPVFYGPDIEQNLTLDEGESRHAVKILRLTKNDPLLVTDGVGGLFQARIADPNAKKCRLEITQKNQSDRQDHVHVALAPTKSQDRMEWLVEKAVEIGVAELSFISTFHSERRKINLDRLRMKAIQAMKQSQQPWLMKLNAIQSFPDFLKGASDTKGPKYLANYVSKQPDLAQVDIESLNPTVLIGPEGDFSSAEIAEAKKSGFMTINLGSTRLRTETAALYAAIVLKSKFF